MKQLLIILFTVYSSLLTLHCLRAQVIKGALIGGLNMSQVDGDENYGFHKYGINAGASAIIPLKHRFSLALEILYSQQGSYQSPIYLIFMILPVNISSGLIMLKCLCLFSIMIKVVLFLVLDSHYGRLVYVAEEQYNPKDKVVEWDNVRLNDGTYKNNDYEVLGDLRVRVYKGFYLNARYSYSMVKIRTRYFYSPL